MDQPRGIAMDQSLVRAVAKKYNIGELPALYIAANVGINEDNIDDKLPVNSVEGFSDRTGDTRPRGPAFSIVDVPREINKGYSLIGGTSEVLKKKMNSPNYSTYRKDANDFYDTGSTISESDSGFMGTVDRYNDFISDTKSEERVPVVYSGLNRPYTGAYHPQVSIVEIPVNPTIDKTLVPNAGDYRNDGNTEHELVHRIQFRVNPDYKTSVDKKNVDRLTYLSSPHEMHARAASLNQLYAKTHGEAIDTDDKVNALVDTFIKNRNIFEKLHDEYRGKKDANGNVPEQVTREAMIGNDPRYKEKMGSITPAEANIMYNILQGMYMKSEMINKGSAIDDAKAAKYLKALIMTTAKNEQAPAYQLNSAIDNGIDIS
jgi:hypothetical protein